MKVLMVVVMFVVIFTVLFVLHPDPPLPNHPSMIYDSRFPLRVDYERSIKDGALAGHYDVVDSGVYGYYYQQIRASTEQVEAILVHFDKSVGSTEVQDDLDKAGLRAGSPWDLLAFAKAMSRSVSVTLARRLIVNFPFRTVSLSSRKKCP